VEMKVAGCGRSPAARDRAAHPLCEMHLPNDEVPQVDGGQGSGDNRDKHLRLRSKNRGAVYVSKGQALV
jgi:hypothetical protein